MPRPPHRALAGALLALAVGGCGDGAEDSGGVCDRTPPLTYETFGQGFMAKHCVGCHSSLNPPGHRKGAPAGVDLDTWEGVRQWAWRIEARSLGEEPDMPPGGGPSTEELARLQEWLDCQVLPSLEGR